MSCSTCQRVKQIPTCTENLTIGTITPDTEVIIYFANLATKRIDFTTAISNSEGLLVADLSELSFAANQAYDIHIHLTDTQTPVEITIGEETYDCLQLRFQRIHGNNGSLNQFTNITLEADA